MVNTNPQEREIRIVLLSGKVERKLDVKGWSHPSSVDWAADSKALLLSFVGQSGATLGRVDFSGHVQPLYTLGGSDFTYGLSSPDGRFLAIYGLSLSGRNVWLFENF
jgi:hypothetical protein